jgi:hypothetical protein
MRCGGTGVMFPDLRRHAASRHMNRLAFTGPTRQREIRVSMNWRSFSIRDALCNPERVFGTPEQVISDPRLDRATKLTILGQWRQIKAALRGKPNDTDERHNEDLYRRIETAIDYLRFSR